MGEQAERNCHFRGKKGQFGPLIFCFLLEQDKERTARALEIAREQIAIDKLNREREYNKKVFNQTDIDVNFTIQMGIVTNEEPKPVVKVEKKEYAECVLQIRMPPPLAKLTGIHFLFLSL